MFSKNILFFGICLFSTFALFSYFQNNSKQIVNSSTGHNSDSNLNLLSDQECLSLMAKMQYEIIATGHDQQTILTQRNQNHSQKTVRNLLKKIRTIDCRIEKAACERNCRSTGGGFDCDSLCRGLTEPSFSSCINNCKEECLSKCPDCSDTSNSNFLKRLAFRSLKNR